MEKYLLTLILILISWGAINAQNEKPQFANVAPSWTTPDLITDRPDQTESSSTVPLKTLQIETGFIFEKFSDDTYEFEDWGIATTLLRYGLLDNLELRLGSNYQLSAIREKATDNDSTQQGVGALSAGLKVYITEEKGAWPEVALLADFTYNQIGKLDYRPTYNYSVIKMLFSHTLSNRFGLGYNLGFANNGENAKGFFVYSLVFSTSLSKKISAFAEIYGNFDDSSIPRNRIDGGFTFLLRHNLQIDASVGFGPEEDGISMWFANAGLSWRIPN
ncbi:MAG: transporter [Bacteroidales bacterium]